MRTCDAKAPVEQQVDCDNTCDDMCSDGCDDVLGEGEEEDERPLTVSNTSSACQPHLLFCFTREHFVTRPQISAGSA